MRLWAVLYAVLDPDQVLHVADRALDLRQQDALLGYGIVQGRFGEFSVFHGDLVFNYNLFLGIEI